MVSEYKKAEFINDMMSYIILWDRWCHIIVLGLHAPTEKNIEYVKDSFYEEWERVYDKFPKYRMNILPK
jgi:hypothetical protein